MKPRCYPQVLQMVQSEHRLGQGPCRHVLELSNPPKVAVGDLANERRWPSYAAEALTVGLADVVAARLDIGDPGGAALLMAAAGPLPTASIDGVEVFAAHAAVALAQTRRYADLRGTVDSRDVIGQAKGILMERYKMTGDRAFALLSRISQDANMPLRQLAQQIADTGVDRTPSRHTDP